MSMIQHNPVLATWNQKR